jgi:thioredoxin 1
LTQISLQLLHVAGHTGRNLLDKNSAPAQGTLNYTNPMATELALTAADFDELVLKSDVPVMIDFWAEWCGPCRMIAPHIEALAQEYTGKAKVFKVDVEKEGAIAERYGILNIPTLLIFKEGKLFDKIVGAYGKDHYKAALDRALA